MQYLAVRVSFAVRVVCRAFMLRSTLLLAFFWLSSCTVVPWKDAVKRMSSDLVPVPTLSAAYRPGTLVRIGPDGWTDQSRPGFTVDLCVQTGPPTDFEFTVDESATARFVADAKSIGLSGQVGAQGKMTLVVGVKGAATSSIPVIDYKSRPSFRVALQRGSRSYSDLAKRTQLHILAKTLCAGEVTIKSSSNSNLGLFVEARPSERDSPVQAIVAAGWKRLDDGSIRYSNQTFPICFGVQTEPVTEGDIDEALGPSVAKCPSENDLFALPVSELQALPVECLEGVYSRRMSLFATLRGGLSNECLVRLSGRVDAAQNLMMAASQLRDARTEESCSADPAKKEQLLLKTLDALKRLEDTARMAAETNSKGPLTINGEPLPCPPQIQALFE